MDRLPDWLSALPEAGAMRAVDRWAIDEQGVSGLDLMERAGAGVADEVEFLAPDGPVAVVCGKGNNGGDGMVVARLLRQAGREVSVVCATPPEELSGDAQENFRRLPGPPPVALEDVELTGAGVIVDALLGTGSSGEPRGAVAVAIDAIDRAGAAVVSVDVPSGVDASTGVVAGRAVTAAVTATFHAGKPGLWINPGKSRAGRVKVIAIGIPRGAPMEAGIGLIEPRVLELLPRRRSNSTKFSSGHVLVAGGSRGLTGAPMMTARAAMRTGAGYVTACLPASQQPVVAASAAHELMTRGLPEADGGLTAAAVEEVLSLASRGGAIALGPGLGRTDGAFAFARELARRAEAALVIDADGLNAHAGALDDLRVRSGETVLTPHAGELARLLECESGDIERERLASVRAAADRSRGVVLLKGEDTLIAEPAGRVAVSPGASPALATAGTGDVLTGVVATLLAQGLHPFEAAAAAAFLHARAGGEAARRCGSPDAVVASDVIAALPAARTATAR